MSKKAAKRKAVAKAKRRKALGGRQQEIPGTAGKRYHDVDDAAVVALEAGRAFTRAGEKRKETYGALRSLMIKHDLRSYVTADKLTCRRPEREETVTVEPPEDAVV